MMMRKVKLFVAFVVLVSGFVPGVYALQDHKPGGYVEDIDALFANFQQPSRPQQDGAWHTFSLYDVIIGGVGFTAAGLVFLYIVNPEVRKAVHRAIGLEKKVDKEVGQ